MRKLLLLFALATSLGTHTGALAQVTGTWATLSKITVATKNDPRGYELEYPVFSQEVKALDGKEITIKGYMVPLEEMRGQQYFVFSALPFNVCYFCGGAGPETVMEVNTVEEIDFTDSAIRIKGRLQLNDSDPEHLMYILHEARRVK